MDYKDIPEGYNVALDFKGEEFKLNKILAWCIKRRKQYAVQNNEDIMLAITGPEGSGKSQFSCMVGRMLDNGFSEKKIFYSTDELIKAHFKGYDYEVLILDESMADLDRRSSNSTSQKNFSQFLSQSSQAKKIVIIILQRTYQDNQGSAV